MLDRSCIVFAGGENLVIKILQQLSHEVIVPLGSASNQSLDFPLNENENKRNLLD
jgi:hypothetical protein